MDERLIRQVEDLGLSEKEARIYLANLVLGPSPVQKLADYAGIKRVTAYVILESLVNLGLASQTSQGKKTFFVAEDPLKLERLLEKREQELKERKVNFRSLLPDLKQLKTLASEAPRVQYYEGREAIRAMVRNFLSSHLAKQAGTVYGISNIDNVDKYFPEFAQAGHNPDRIKAQLTSRFLYTSSRGAILKATDAASHRESRFVPLEHFPFDEDINVSEDYVVFLVLSGRPKPVAITVASVELANAMKAIFELAWTGAERYQV